MSRIRRPSSPSASTLMMLPFCPTCIWRKPILRIQSSKLILIFFIKKT